MENVIQTKDDQNSVLLGEKNSLEMKTCEAEVSVAKINKTIYKIHDEKEALKVINGKHEATILGLQLKFLDTPLLDTYTTSAAVKKLNEN